MVTFDASDIWMGKLITWSHAKIIGWRLDPWQFLELVSLESGLNENWMPYFECDRRYVAINGESTVSFIWSQHVVLCIRFMILLSVYEDKRYQTSWRDGREYKPTSLFISWKDALNGLSANEAEVGRYLIYALADLWGPFSYFTERHTISHTEYLSMRWW